MCKESRNTFCKCIVTRKLRAGIALIFGVDRILDMCRTATNVTGDAAVATVVAASEGQLRPTALNGLAGGAPAGSGS